jgi:alpha-tubulin suppressor-like RCC1 family protein
MGDNLNSIDLGSGRTATAIEAGKHHTCAILDNASIKCWGSNSSGQLGLGNTNNLGDASGEMGDNLPTVDLGTGITAKSITTGDSHTCAILDNSSIKCWGSNASGQLGLGDTSTRGDGSGEMGDNLPTVDLGSGRTAKSIATGDSHTCAILDNSAIKCWGLNTTGQLGLGDTNNRGDGSSAMGDTLPEVELGSGRTAKAIAAGDSHTCAILDNSAIKCWGRSDEGQMGKGGKNGSNFQIGDSSGEMGDSLTAIEIGTGRTATAISAGKYHTCTILDNSSIKCWGSNNTGQLGLGDTSNRGDLNSLGSSEMGDSLSVVDLGAGRTARGITAGDNQTCAILDNASIKCWGSNSAGQLGLGDTSNRGDGSGEMGDNLPVISL